MLRCAFVFVCTTWLLLLLLLDFVCVFFYFVLRSFIVSIWSDCLCGVVHSFWICLKRLIFLCVNWQFLLIFCTHISRSWHRKWRQRQRQLIRKNALLIWNCNEIALKSRNTNTPYVYNFSEFIAMGIGKWKICAWNDIRNYEIFARWSEKWITFARISDIVSCSHSSNVKVLIIWTGFILSFFSIGLCVCECVCIYSLCELSWKRFV